MQLDKKGSSGCAWTQLACKTNFKTVKEVSTDADDSTACSYTRGRFNGVSSLLLGRKTVGFQGHGKAQDSLKV